MLYMNIAEGMAPTGRVLRELLVERGVEVTSLPTNSPTMPSSGAILCWGNGYTGRLPSLNRNCTQFDKLRQLQVLSSPESHNLLTVPFFPVPGMVPPTAYPCFMRKLSHAGGTDIRLALEPEHVSLYTQNGWRFATKYIPNQREYRVWVYRRQHLGTYEKHLARTNEFLASRRFGANFDNGYAFRLVASEQLPREAVAMASEAVQALGLDFGAVDILQGRDGNFYILEVNTAPGVEGPDRQVIQMLANKIAWWVNHNYPRRNGDEGAYERPNRPAATPTRATDSFAGEDEEEEVLEATPRPSFLPRPGESFSAWAARVNT